MNDTLYEQCLQEEKELQFSNVNQTSLLQLGLDLYECSQGYAGPVAIQIVLNDKVVFSFYPEGTGKFHEMWLTNKARLVKMREMSTLRAFLELERSGETLEKDWNLDSREYAACGGGFPMRIQGGSVVGSICVSGLPHLQDHEILIKGIRKYLNERE